MLVMNVCMLWIYMLWMFVCYEFVCYELCMLWIYDVYIQYVLPMSKWYLIISNDF